MTINSCSLISMSGHTHTWLAWNAICANIKAHVAQYYVPMEAYVKNEKDAKLMYRRWQVKRKSPAFAVFGLICIIYCVFKDQDGLIYGRLTQKKSTYNRMNGESRLSEWITFGSKFHSTFLWKCGEKKKILNLFVLRDNKI